LSNDSNHIYNIYPFLLKKNNDKNELFNFIPIIIKINSLFICKPLKFLSTNPIVKQIIKF